MDLNNWNRKDSTPDKTIQKIQGILKDNNIETVLVSNINHKDLWFSNRIEIKGLPGVGTNGKGVSEDFALASAYGEFMERLQSGYLLGNLFYCKHPKRATTSKQIETYLNSKKILHKFFKSSTKQYTDQELKDLEHIISLDTEMDTYIDLLGKMSVDLPRRYIDVLCGSNGLASGNTYEEAFSQGMCEVFERYVMQYIYKKNYPCDFFPKLNKNVYSGTKSYNLIKEIEKMHYSVYVIDCSLKGLLPVLGVLIIDPTKSKYVFKIASDINLDICLQRCITEIFQGVTFDVNFRLHMNSILNYYSTGDFWHQGNLCIEHTKSEVNGTGSLPRQFIRGLSYETTDVTVFDSTIKSNIEAARLLLTFAKRISNNIFVSNFSILGFPTIRIFIPQVAEAYYFEGHDIKHALKCLYNLRQSLLSNEINTVSFLENLLFLLNYCAYNYNLNLIKIFGIVLRNISGVEYIYDPYRLVSFIALHLGMNELAIEYLKLSNQLSNTNIRESNIDMLIFEAIIKNVDKCDFIEYSTFFSHSDSFLEKVDAYYSIRANGVELCSKNCDSCPQLQNCCYNDFAKIEFKYCSKVQDFNDFLDKICLYRR